MAYPLRSMLFVPGNRQRFLDKLDTVRPDAVILDLEDSVPPAEKQAARETVGELLRSDRFSHQQLYVRVNACSTGLTAVDIQAVVARRLVGVLLPKVETANELREMNMLLSEAESRHELPIGRTRVIPIIETTRGVLHAEALASVGRRVEAVAFGYEDFTLDLGVPRTNGGTETLYPRAHLAIAARAAGVLAIDGPTSDFGDAQALRDEATTSRSLGFTGKQCIHPSQIGTLNQVFTPTDAEVAHARGVIAAYERVAAQGHGSTSLEGRMLDAPVVARARRLIELYAHIVGEAGPTS
ncbi:MAG: CoA ester lyase [Chloroflexi bacterium]|nr:CoA ester lyase [Chloroflexota bacterium]